MECAIFVALVFTARRSSEEIAEVRSLLVQIQIKMKDMYTRRLSSEDRERSIVRAQHVTAGAYNSFTVSVLNEDDLPSSRDIGCLPPNLRSTW